MTLALLGVSFFALSYNYAKGEKSEELQAKAEMVAKLAVTYLEADGTAYPADLQQLASFAASVSDVDFLMCNTNGNVLLTTDESLEGQVVTLPENLTSAVLEDGPLRGLQPGGRSLRGKALHAWACRRCPLPVSRWWAWYLPSRRSPP